MTGAEDPDEILAEILRVHEERLNDPQPRRYELSETPAWRAWAAGVTRDLCRTPGAHPAGVEVHTFPCAACVDRVSALAGPEQLAAAFGVTVEPPQE